MTCNESKLWFNMKGKVNSVTLNKICDVATLTNGTKFLHVNMSKN